MLIILKSLKNATSNICALLFYVLYFITCALMSDPKSNSNLTVGVWPFIAANIRGDMPSLLPVLYIIQVVMPTMVKITNVTLQYEIIQIE